MKKVNDQEVKLQEYNSVVDKIQDIDGCEQTDLTKEQTSLNNRFHNTKASLQERSDILEETTSNFNKLDDDMKTLGDGIEKVKQSLEKLSKKPVKEKTADEILQLQSELLDYKATLQTDYVIADWLIEKSECDPLLVQDLKSRLDQEQTSSDDVMKALLTLKSHVVKTFDQNKSLEDKLDSFEVHLHAVDQKISALKPVSGKFVEARNQRDLGEVSILCIYFLFCKKGCVCAGGEGRGDFYLIVNFVIVITSLRVKHIIMGFLKNFSCYSYRPKREYQSILLFCTVFLHSIL